MKNRKYFICITALFIAVMGLSACSNYLDTADNYGSIYINLGSAGERFAVTEKDTNNIKYAITLTSKGQEDIKKTISNATGQIKIEVPVGIWTVKIDAEGLKPSRIAKGHGEKSNIEVKAEELTPVEISMKTTATRVYTWEELCSDLANTEELPYPDLEYIEIANDLVASKTAESRATRVEAVLKAEDNITITRGDSLKDSLFNVFNILILEGNITLDGDKENFGKDNASALINVEIGGHLRIWDGVTLYNNKSFEGGGVNVKGGRFTMYGGKISGNTAERGGGVFVSSGASFIKNGGTVFGSGAEDLSNKANVAGHAVYINGIAVNETLLPENKWP
ncbi:MAG: hypothetical protein LBU82_07205 [Treponema sp.]|jgi:hypothetical protein|nr:hypothetical protein [Treponema sp.]